MSRLRSIVVLGLLLLSCSYKEKPSKDCSTNKEIINDILIKKVSFSIMTFGFVDCKNFESLFQQQLDSSRVTNQEVTTEFLTKVLNLKSDTTEIVVNVRAKAIINYDNMPSDTVCLGKFALVFNGKKLQYDAEFKTLLSNKFNILVDE